MGQRRLATNVRKPLAANGQELTRINAKNLTADERQIYADGFPGENSGHDFVELYLRTSASIRGCSLLFVSIRVHSWLICGS